MSQLRDVLNSVAGVWDGTYSHFALDGTLLEKYACHQETRMDGDSWFERVVYRREDQPEEVLDFRAQIVGENLLFEDDNFVGRTIPATPQMFLFPYSWKDRPNLKILELVYLVNENYRTRHWQHFENDRLVKTSMIEETRTPNGKVAIWR